MFRGPARGIVRSGFFISGVGNPGCERFCPCPDAAGAADAADAADAGAHHASKDGAHTKSSIIFNFQYSASQTFNCVQYLSILG